MGALKSPDDLRSVRRQRVLKDGKIVTQNLQSVIDCTIRDLSESGARLQCSHQSAVPSEFALLLPSQNTIRDARAVWRRAELIGIVFTGPWRTAPPRKW